MYARLADQPQAMEWSPQLSNKRLLQYFLSPASCCATCAGRPGLRPGIQDGRTAYSSRHAHPGRLACAHCRPPCGRRGSRRRCLGSRCAVVSKRRGGSAASAGGSRAARTGGCRAAGSCAAGARGSSAACAGSDWAAGSGAAGPGGRCGEDPGGVACGVCAHAAAGAAPGGGGGAHPGGQTPSASNTQILAMQVWAALQISDMGLAYGGAYLRSLRNSVRLFCHDLVSSEDLCCCTGQQSQAGINRAITRVLVMDVESSAALPVVNRMA